VSRHQNRVTIFHFHKFKVKYNKIKIHLWGRHLSPMEKATGIFGISCSVRASALALHYILYPSHAFDEVQLFFPVEKNHTNTISSII
jgi:hypothetical protein